MTNDHDDDAGLAPVTDLFGARSARRRGLTPTPASPAAESDASGWASDDAAEVGPRAIDHGADERAAPHDGDSANGTFADGASADVPEDADADAPVPLPFTGSRAQADWLSPVVGDGTRQSGAAAHAGSDEESSAEASTAAVFAIGSGVEIDPVDAPRPIDEQRADAERLSMRALGRRGVSESELRKLLGENDLDEAVVDHEIERLTRVGLIDDVALATDLVDRLHDRKGLGRQGVVAELRRRGIDQAAIEAALDAAADDEDDEFVRAIELAEKRAGQLRGLDRATAERRLSGFLMRKGYNGGVVRIAVERALDGGGRPKGGPRGSVRFE